MKHLSSIVLAVAVVAAFATACFTDPTSSLRKGASRIELSRSAVTLATGDSLAIQAELKDDQGNTYDAGALQWATDNAAVATVRVDSTPIPYGAFSRGFVLAASATGGVAHITVSLGSISTGFRVLNVPAGFSASAPTLFRGGVAVKDTIVTKNPDNTVTRDIFTSGDTVVFKLATGSTLSFNATASTVSFGAAKAYILAQSADSIKVVARNSFHGRPWITKLTWHGPAEVGDVALDSLQGNVIAVAKPRYRGAIAVASGIVMTINAPPTGVTFRTGTTPTGVVINGKPASIITRTASSLVVADTVTADSAGVTSGVIITNVNYSGGIVFDSLWSTGSYTISRVSFPGTISTPASLMDTIKVRAPGLLDAVNSNVVVGGVIAWSFYRSADSIFAVAKRTGAISVTNVTISGVTFPSLSPAHPVNVPASPTGEPNEPGNNVRATATTVAFTGAADTIVVYGALDCEDDGTACPGNGDLIDYYQIAFAGGTKLRAIVTWYGNGTAGGSAYNDTNNPDIDVAIRDAAANYYGTNTGANGSGAIMPEIATTTTLAAGTYYIRVMAWVTPSPITYQLQLIRTP
jgi:hypothetical protein